MTGSGRRGLAAPAEGERGLPAVEKQLVIRLGQPRFHLPVICCSPRSRSSAKSLRLLELVERLCHSVPPVASPPAAVSVVELF